MYYLSFDAEHDEEMLGCFVATAETVVNSITFKILTKKMKVISSRSLVRSAMEPGIFQNLRANRQGAALNIAPKQPKPTIAIGNKKVGVGCCGDCPRI